MNKNGRNFKFSGGNFINIRDNQSKIGGKLKVRGKYVWSKSEIKKNMYGAKLK